eukprot:3886769-Rhodomonas_salina.1
MVRDKAHCRSRGRRAAFGGRREVYPLARREVECLEVVVRIFRCKGRRPWPARQRSGRTEQGIDNKEV